MKGMSWVLAAVTCGGLIGLISGGCGILSAPLTVPMAIEANTNFSFVGVVVDQEGRLLDGVLMEQELSHVFWEPLIGQTATHERKQRVVNGRVKVSERGRYLSLTFTKEGYEKVELQLLAGEPGIVRIGTDGSANVPDFQVVMVRASVEDATTKEAGPSNR